MMLNNTASYTKSHSIQLLFTIKIQYIFYIQEYELLEYKYLSALFWVQNLRHTMGCLR